jgi:hypothetical protein
MTLQMPPDWSPGQLRYSRSVARDPRSLREFARRDRELVIASRDAHRRRAVPGSATRIGDLLRQHAQAMRPDWPSVEDRLDDLRHHVRLADALRRIPRQRR